MDFINLNNARTEEQVKVMQQIEIDNVCPFCPENLSNYHKQPILDEGNYWIMTTNQWPYEGSKVHLLAISKKHIQNISEVSSESSAELFDLFKRTAAKLNVVGGAIAMRFGPSSRYASSVNHLHAHLIEPDLDDPHHLGIKFPISKPSTLQT